MSHKPFLDHTLRLAESQRGACAPNPSVGAIVVSDGRVVAEGIHNGPGTPHAEIVAIKQSKTSLENAILYVTLEPCSHWGKTPPCFDAIIQSGIKHVVFGYSDPNPLTKKINIIEAFKQQGIRCDHVEHEGITAFYHSYQYWMTHKRPFVTAKIAQSLDGKIAGPQKEVVKLTGETLDIQTHQHRAASDMILTTAETIKQDNPQLTVRLNGECYGKIVVILDRTLKLTGSEQVFESAKQVICFYDKERKPNEADTDKRRYIPVSSIDNKLNLDAVLDILGGLGCHDLWIESGASLFSYCLSKGLLNRLLLYIEPCYLGLNHFSAYQGLEPYLFKEHASLSWQVIDDSMIADIAFKR